MSGPHLLAGLYVPDLSGETIQFVSTQSNNTRRTTGLLNGVGTHFHNAQFHPGGQGHHPAYNGQSQASASASAQRPGYIDSHNAYPGTIDTWAQVRPADLSAQQAAAPFQDDFGLSRQPLTSWQHGHHFGSANERPQVLDQRVEHPYPQHAVLQDVQRAVPTVQQGNASGYLQSATPSIGVLQNYDPIRYDPRTPLQSDRPAKLPLPANPSSRSSHSARSHNSERYYCDVPECGKSCSRQGDLERHKDDCHRDGPERYSCCNSTCSRTFNRKDKVKAHCRSGKSRTGCNGYYDEDGQLHLVEARSTSSGASMSSGRKT